MVHLNLGLTALAFVSVCSAIATGGDFNILSFNVAGLPAILNGNEVSGDKATNAGTIGKLFSKYDYDVINMQEDFAFHAYIYATDTHPYRTPTSGTAAIGSGLNTVANFNWFSFSREKWETCSNASGADCLTPKGFTFMRVQVSEGVYVDMYNLHTDAGTEAADEVARSANVQQVANYVDKWSAGNSVIIFGDTNSRYTRALDNIAVFQTQNHLIDPFVQLQRGGVNPTVETLCDNPSRNNNCETVDKVFYRGSKQLALTATYFNYESTKFLQADGSILSDHNPITVNFTWSVAPTRRQSPFYGGPHGTWFNDLDYLPTSPRASVITFRGASRVDSVGVTLTSGATFTHGGTGGTATSLTLNSGEYWTTAKLCQGQKDGWTRIFYIQATTSTGRTLATGTTTVDCVTYAAPKGWGIVGFLGQGGDEVDQLGLLYAPY
ncbi:DNase I-like protein [Glarea lozoyensis ATCC 20868]|uniref:DNase I-like protein n=1 Tax=Glarea lozoyensis (strain ATCC 20868 / MF5171) TaxID=1116229 RepID=S3CJK9_GLAL2|nr:DNase I-like protein [Glarea lozoyensis ATCC 20868]EPE25404.1 DNase I-like protein [Glarea lozoyensis ATCC 20868]